MPYTEFKLGGESIAGCMPMPPMIPAQVPPHWLVYFAVDDTDATVAQANGARRLGADAAHGHAGGSHRGAGRPPGRHLRRHQDGAHT